MTAAIWAWLRKGSSSASGSPNKMTNADPPVGIAEDVQPCHSMSNANEMTKVDYLLGAVEDAQPIQSVSNTNENTKAYSPVEKVEGRQTNQVLGADRSRRSWRGSPLEELMPRNICTYPPLEPPNRHHIVLFKLPIPSEGHLEPYHPSWPNDKSDVYHVRMPHSPQNLFKIPQRRPQRTWRMIQNTYSKPINTSYELERAILWYNPCARSSFDALHEFFGRTYKREAGYFFSVLLPDIIKLAFEIEDQFRGPLPILKQGCNGSISMSQVQAGVLLANAFLCTFPGRNWECQHPPLPNFNFIGLFQLGSIRSVQQKLMCFMHYLRRILEKRPTGVVTYTRRHLMSSELPRWSDSNARLCRVHISTGSIEDTEGGMMEIDFANKNVGGGVLGRGAVQEEIRFAVCPELVVARLFCETLDDTEALIVTGCERFSNYEGYASSFTWSGNHDSTRPRDSYRRLNTTVVAIDASEFDRPCDQFKMRLITRELNKAYTGFSFGQEGAIATGNWGCGAFRGDPLLKFIIQLMAASECRKPLAYFTFNDAKLRDKLSDMHHFLMKKNTTVGTLWRITEAYASSYANVKSGEALFDHIYWALGFNEGVRSLLGDSTDDGIPEDSSKGRRESEPAYAGTGSWLAEEKELEYLMETDDETNFDKTSRSAFVGLGHGEHGANSPVSKGDHPENASR